MNTYDSEIIIGMSAKTNNIIRYLITTICIAFRNISLSKWQITIPKQPLQQSRPQ